MHALIKKTKRWWRRYWKTHATKKALLCDNTTITIWRKKVDNNVFWKLKRCYFIMQIHTTRHFKGVHAGDKDRLCGHVFFTHFGGNWGKGLIVMLALWGCNSERSKGRRCCCWPFRLLPCFRFNMDPITAAMTFQFVYYNLYVCTKALTRRTQQ